MFSPIVLAHWLPDAGSAPADDGVVVAIDPALPATRAVSLLRTEGGSTILSLSPERAGEFDLAAGTRLDDEELSALLQRHGITLNDPDHLFYLPHADHAGLRAERVAPETRPLSTADAVRFADFGADAPEDELDEAFVELDHWLVYGTFVEDRLVCAASMYPWSGTRFADLGVITLPEFRGRSLARRTVRAIGAAALERGYEPQYRCQIDNVASVALARAAGFARFGTWEVAVEGTPLEDF
ncbi:MULTISPECIES: GNAT family N-acetyltransferase [unclassified Microbacterium]|uniref:GNAT family N-acetyltransferase n=1 Tax=unclassified Microbacterium TaxID=2609290 RepID=UPI00341D7F66